MSSWNLGLLGAAAASAPPGAFELIQTTVLSSNAMSVTFSSLPSTYTHLQIRGVVRSTNSDPGNTNAIMTFNGVTGTSYSWHQLFGGGSSVSTDRSWNDSAGPIGSVAPGGTSVANSFGAFVTDILEYQNTSKNKTVRTLGGAASSFSRVGLNSILFRSTDAVNSIKIENGGLTFAAGSRFSLYGIKG